MLHRLAWLVCCALFTWGPLHAQPSDAPWIQVEFVDTGWSDVLQTRVLNDLAAGLMRSGVSVYDATHTATTPPLAVVVYTVLDNGEVSFEVIHPTTEHNATRQIRLVEMDDDELSMAIAISTEELVRASLATRDASNDPAAPPNDSPDRPDNPPDEPIAEPLPLETSPPDATALAAAAAGPDPVSADVDAALTVPGDDDAGIRHETSALSVIDASTGGVTMVGADLNEALWLGRRVMVELGVGYRQLLSQSSEQGTLGGYSIQARLAAAVTLVSLEGGFRLDAAGLVHGIFANLSTEGNAGWVGQSSMVTALGLTAELRAVWRLVSWLDVRVSVAAGGLPVGVEVDSPDGVTSRLTGGLFSSGVGLGVRW